MHSSLRSSPEQWRQHSFRLPSDEVHIWQICFPDVEPGLGLFRSLLSHEERERMLRFHFERDRTQFACTRGMLRCILARYLATMPEAICIGYGTNGKPYLSNSSGSRGIAFNVSHSGDVALIAVAAGREVGIDIERVRTDIHVEALAGSIFSEPERRAVASAPDVEKHRSFFRFWTCKEAYVKAGGSGLLCALQEFAVFPSDHLVSILTPDGEFERHSEMRLFCAAFENSYEAALVVEGWPASIRCFNAGANLIFTSNSITLYGTQPKVRVMERGWGCQSAS